MSNKRWLWPLILLFFSGTTIGEQRYVSSAEQTQLIELYTSEGCSSCPPADQWLSRYKNSPELWQRFIPIAFHVDYWNDIGWPDRFSSPEYTKRQRLHKRQRNIREVYTPGFVVNGSEWKGWYRRKPLPSGDGYQPGELSLNVDKKAFSANFSPAIAEDVAAILTVAVLGFDLKTSVKAGENKGKTLAHNFVVLGIKSYDGKEGQWQGSLPEVAAEYENTPLAVTAWVSGRGSLKPRQAVGGWLK